MSDEVIEALAKVVRILKALSEGERGQVLAMLTAKVTEAK